MQLSGLHADCMHRNVQIRHVPEQVHRALKIRAARAGQSLSDYLLAEIVQISRRPTLDDLLDRIREREPVRGLDSAAAVRAEREGRR
jgi:plasmid stability protein